MVEGKPVLSAIIVMTIVAEEGKIYPFPTYGAIGIEWGLLFFCKKFREELPDFLKYCHCRFSRTFFVIKVLKMLTGRGENNGMVQR